MGQRGDIARRAGEPRHEQEIFVPADQFWHRIAAVEHKAGGDCGRHVHALRIVVCHCGAP
jgi:hypothetical protein